MRVYTSCRAADSDSEPCLNFVAGMSGSSVTQKVSPGRSVDVHVSMPLRVCVSVVYGHGAGGAPRQAQVQREQVRVRIDARSRVKTDA